MARRVRDTNLETRTGRRTLKVRGKPYWRALDKGLHLGYRRRPAGGTWIARRFTEAGRYSETKLGVADDYQDADGVQTLTYSQALAAARTWHRAGVRQDAGLEKVHEGPYTVGDALADYLRHYAKEGKGLSVTQAAVNAHILPALGSVALDRLTTRKIVTWHQSLAESPARLRTSKAAKTRNVRPEAKGPDAVRRRRATANRILTILKAALNRAWKDGKTPSDTAWRKVKPFRSVSAPVVRYLTREECTRLINACPDDLRRLVKAALLTGCRYSELAALQARDFDPDVGTVIVRTSKSGKPRHVVLTEEGRDVLTTLTLGKTSGELILTRGHGEPWGKSHQSRPLAEACRHASITPAVSFHVLRHTHGSLLAMQGVPMPVIAQQLGHADTRMTEKHYAHLSPSYVADTIRQNFPTLGIGEGGGVVKLRESKG